ncbi:hypothetical protein KUL118_01690 [Tenacibaculum sp. KUL118]|nr:hypothetical protein KUL118_01690 [Tenacibaculum sp. KUL118]
MAQYINIQASLLRFCSDNAKLMRTLVGTEFKSLNLDAFSNEDDLPDGDFIGIEDLAVQSSSDDTPLDTLSAAVTISTVSDTNNMRLTKVVDHIFECLRPSKAFTLFDEKNGARRGNITCMNMTQILPVQDGKNSRVIQSIIFQASALDESIK